MAPEHHAGGWVDRDDGRGWVLDQDPPEDVVPTAPAVVDEPKAPAAPAPAPEPDRAACPDCGVLVRLKKDGTLRKHQCVDPADVADDETHQTHDDEPPAATADETESEQADG